MTMKEMADKLGLNYREIRLGYHLTNNPNKLMPGKIEYVTMHQTDNTDVGVDAYQHHKYLANNSQGREASWHWTVDEQEAVQSFRDNRVMYHSATPEGNNKSMSIEMCIDADVAGKTYMGETNYRKTLDNGAKLAAIKLVEYGLTVADIRQHHDWSGKNCPSGIRAKKYNISWTDFLSMVAKHYDTLTKPAEQIISTGPAPDGKLFQVAVGAYAYRSNALETVEKAKAAGLNAYLILINDPRR